jgi:hypothetical protein
MANYLKELWGDNDSLQLAAESLNTAGTRSIDDAKESGIQGQQKEDKPNMLFDIAAAPIRGLEGTAQGVYGLMDMIAFDALPDWKDEDRLFGRSETMVGGFVEGLTQFLVPFFPLKAAMKLGKVGKGFAKLGSKRSDLARDITAGAITDFAAFDGHEERLSNLVNMFPKFGNPVTDYLAAEKDDTEAEGRFKNTIEGLLIEAGLRGAFRGVMQGVMAVKLRKQKLAEGKTNEQAGREATEEAEVKANELKLSEEDDAFDPIDSLEQQELKLQEFRDKTNFKENSDQESKVFKEVNTPRNYTDSLDDPDYNYKDAREAVLRGQDDKLVAEGRTAAQSLEVFKNTYGQDALDAFMRGKELKTKELDPKDLSDPSTNYKDMSWNELRAESKRAGLGGQGTKAEILKRLEDNQTPRPSTDLESGQGQLLSPDQATGKEPNFRTSEVYKEAQSRKGEQRPVNKADNTFKSGDAKVEQSRQMELGLKDIDNDRVPEGQQAPKTPDRLVADIVAKLDQGKKEGGSRGFKQALAGSIRNVANSSNMMITARALAVHLEKTIDVSSKSFDEIIADAKDYASEIGVKEHDHVAKLYETKDDIPAMKKVMAEQEALRTINLEIGQELRIAADNYAEIKQTGKGSLDEAEVEIMGLLEKHRETQRLWSLYGRDISRAFLQRKAYYRGSGAYNKRIALTKQELASAADRMAYKKRNIGSMKTEELVAKIRKAVSPDQVIGGIVKADNAKLNAITKGTDGSRMMQITMEYWMNSLLSSPATQVVNTIGNMSIYMMRAAEEYVGAAFSGDKALMEAISRYVFKAEGISESWSLFKHAWKDDNARLIPDARVYDDSVDRAHAIYKEGDDAFANAINFIGDVVRAPSRLLLAGDEFFKQLNYRYFIRTSVYASEIAKKGTTSKYAAEQAETALRMSLTKDGRMLSERNVGMEAYNTVNKMDDELYERTGERMSAVQRETEMKRLFESQGTNLRNKFIGMDQADERLRLPDAAADYARVSTATKDIPQIQEPLSRLAHYFPLAKMVFPFVRTPTNLLKMGLERTPLGGGVQVIRELTQGKFLEQARETFKNGTNREKAQLKGKMATTVATTTALTMYVSSNSQFISGGGPRNKDEREALKLSGWQPYSIKVGDKWLSYVRLDPMSTSLGILADMAETPKYYDVQDDALEGMFTMVSVAFMNNITNKSFVDGIDNLFKVSRDPVTHGKTFIGSLAGGFVPNIVNQAANNLGEDRMLVDTRTWFDYVRKRMPSGSASMPPKRNFLGEAQFIENGVAGLGVVNPLYISYASENPEDVEISKLLHGFSMPESKLSNADDLDLKKMTTRNGQDAYDRYLELSGTLKLGDKTLRQQLRQLVTHPSYQLLPENEIMDETGLQSPRVKAITKMITLYRAHAKKQLMAEMPDLQSKVRNNYKKRADYLLNLD